MITVGACTSIAGHSDIKGEYLVPIAAVISPILSGDVPSGGGIFGHGHGSPGAQLPVGLGSGHIVCSGGHRVGGIGSGEHHVSTNEGHSVGSTGH